MTQRLRRMPKPMTNESLQPKQRRMSGGKGKLKIIGWNGCDRTHVSVEVAHNSFGTLCNQRCKVSANFLGGHCFFPDWQEIKHNNCLRKSLRNQKRQGESTTAAIARYLKKGTSVPLKTIEKGLPQSYFWNTDTRSWHCRIRKQAPILVIVPSMKGCLPRRRSAENIIAETVDFLKIVIAFASALAVTSP